MKPLMAIVLISAVLVAPALYAEPVSTPIPGIRGSIARIRFDGDIREQSLVPLRTAGTNSRANKTRAAIGLGFLGMFAGAWIGAALEGNCACDDPGMQGAMIGAPVGATLGAILGWRLGR